MAKRKNSKDLKDSEELQAWKEETERALQEIRRLLKEAGMSQRRLEKLVGFSPGYISQLLSRNLDLKLFHVLAMLAALREDVGAFFSRAYPSPKKRRALDDFQLQSGPLTDEVEEFLGRYYEHGADSIRSFRERLERCERRVAQLEEALDDYRQRKRKA